MLRNKIIEYGGLDLGIVKWTYAKTMPDCPHFYIVKKPDIEKTFEKTVEYLRTFGCTDYFYDKSGIYLYLGIYWKIWTMGAPIKETTIINIAYRGNNLSNKYSKFSAEEKNPNECNIFESSKI